MSKKIECYCMLMKEVISVATFICSIFLPLECRIVIIPLLVILKYGIDYILSKQTIGTFLKNILLDIIQELF